MEVVERRFLLRISHGRTFAVAANDLKANLPNTRGSYHKPIVLHIEVIDVAWQ